MRNITKWVSLDGKKKACENMINKHSWLHRLDSDRHRLRSFSGSQTVGHTVTAFWGCTTKASFVEWTKNIMSLLMLSCWPSFTKVKPCSFKTCRVNGNKPFFLHSWDMPQKVCRATGEHTWKHTSQLLERFMISRSQKTKQLSLFFYFFGHAS